MLTPQGWSAAGLALAAIAAGRLLGVLELFILGTSAASLLLATVLRAALARVEVGVRRDIHPPKVYAGSPSRIELELLNQGGSPTPVLRLHDAVGGTAGADLSIAPLLPGGSTRAAYRLPTERRGKVRIGPLDLVLEDPFGLTRVKMRGAGTTELTVYPRVDPLIGLPDTTGHDPEASREAPSSLGRSGDELFALRPYQVGDELRRVHWPSTARFDELHVRQMELPWQGRLTVLLDLRSSTQTAASLDISVSAVASIITAARKAGDLFRLVCTDGTDSGFAPGNVLHAAVLEYLATVAASPAANLSKLLDSLARSSNGGALVVVSTLLPRHDRARVDALGTRFTTLTVVQVQPSAWNPHRPPEELEPSSPEEIDVTRDAAFAQAWNRAMVLRRQRSSLRRAVARA